MAMFSLTTLLTIGLLALLTPLLPLAAPDRSGAFVVALDLRAHEISLEHSDGRSQRIALTPERPVGAVVREVMAALEGLAGGVTIDVGRREVRVEERVVELTTKEFDLLRFLAERPGLALSRQQILDGVWGYDWFGDARTVDVHIAQVRKKLGDAATITTVRGVGYRLESSRSASATT